MQSARNSLAAVVFHEGQHDLLHYRGGGVGRAQEGVMVVIVVVRDGACQCVVLWSNNECGSKHKGQDRNQCTSFWSTNNNIQLTIARDPSGTYHVMT